MLDESNNKSIRAREAVPLVYKGGNGCKQPKTIPGPMRKFPEMENAMGSVVSEILMERQNT